MLYVKRLAGRTGILMGLLKYGLINHIAYGLSEYRGRVNIGGIKLLNLINV